MDNSADDPRLEQAFDLIRQVVRDTEKRVAQEIVTKILKSVSTGGVFAEATQAVAAERDVPASEGDQSATEEAVATTAPPVRAEPPTKRKRARQGLVREVVMRELANAPAGGLTPSEIANRVRTDEERAISASSFRSELRAGGEAGIYKSVEGGKWVLAHVEEEDEKAGSAVESNPAFSLGEPEGR